MSDQRSLHFAAPRLLFWIGSKTVHGGHPTSLHKVDASHRDDHPSDAEAVRELSKTFGEESRGERHANLAAVRQRAENLFRGRFVRHGVRKRYSLKLRFALALTIRSE